MAPFRTRVVLVVAVVVFLTATTLIAFLTMNITTSVVVSPSLATVGSVRQDSCDIAERNYSRWYWDLFTQGIISVDQLNVLYCPVPKNMHSRMYALLGRYIMGKPFDVVTGKELGITWRLMESLAEITTYKVGSMRNLQNKLQSHYSGIRFALIRDPIERFISVWLCFCYRQKSCRSRSLFLCKEDIYCMLGNISRLLTDKSWKSKHRILAHFRPQHHFCFFQQCHSAYRLFYYSDSESLAQPLTDYLVKLGFPPQMLNTGWGKYKNSSWHVAERDNHNTATRYAGYRRGLLGNVTLVNDVYRVYKEDYDFFHLKVPKVYLRRCGESEYQHLDICQLSV